MAVMCTANNQLDASTTMWHPYTYCGGNPLNVVDLMGMDYWVIF